jgi:hypothetical protein
MANQSKGEAPEYREARRNHPPDAVPNVLAKQAVKTGRVRYILTVSLALAIVLMLLTYLLVV